MTTATTAFARQQTIGDLMQVKVALDILIDSLIVAAGHHHHNRLRLLRALTTVVTMTDSITIVDDDLRKGLDSYVSSLLELKPESNNPRKEGGRTWSRTDLEKERILESKKSGGRRCWRQVAKVSGDHSPCMTARDRQTEKGSQEGTQPRERRKIK